MNSPGEWSLILQYFLLFAGALAMTWLLTPAVRAMCRRLGMVDQPSARRINRVPVPRGGGLALYLGGTCTFWIYVAVASAIGCLPAGVDVALYARLMVPGAAIVIIGFADDRWNLPAKVKLAGQLAVAFAVWAWADVGFMRLFPWLPVWGDALLTVFWIVGAVNAFNLIDGLDGLASGLALIAAIGMAGCLFLLEQGVQALMLFAFIGALAGFLRYNYNPASIFLGDCGSMFLGYFLSIVPLVFHSERSFIVSLGVPLLAMGVPIFDTVLAIVRRTLRRLINRSEGIDSANGKVMTADADHLHHRILRSVGMNQRKAAWILYGIACVLTATGMFALVLRSRSAGVWIVFVAMAAVVVFRDLARIELFDAGRLLQLYAHRHDAADRRRYGRMAVPLLVALDISIVIGVFVLSMMLLEIGFSFTAVRTVLLIYLVCIFATLVCTGSYSTVWARSTIGDYLRLSVAAAVGTAGAAALAIYVPSVPAWGWRFPVLFALLLVPALCVLRLVRGIVRDVFYSLDRRRILTLPGVSRMLVYGAGLRYQYFRRELVRSSAANSRVIVGLLDDDLMLRGHTIGGLRVLGPIALAPELVRTLKIDTVVVACELNGKRRQTVREHLSGLGVKTIYFTFTEQPL